MDEMSEIAVYPAKHLLEGSGRDVPNTRRIGEGSCNQYQPHARAGARHPVRRLCPTSDDERGQALPVATGRLPATARMAARIVPWGRRDERTRSQAV